MLKFPSFMRNTDYIGRKAMKNGIEIMNVEQTFNGRKVLNGINVKIEKGEIFGLLGPSGAGKTTLIKILTGQLKQTAGKAEILGKDARKLTGEDYKKIGIMMDNFGLYERLSCFDNLKLFAKIYEIKDEEISEILKRNQSTIKTRLFRAREQLQQLLKGEDFYV